MDRMTYVKHPHSWNRGKYPTKYTSRHTFQKVVARLAAYEDTNLMPEEITTGRPACVFYCNRQCNLNGDFCAEGPGCPFELDGARARRFLLQITQPNIPLTLEELQKMDGKPVWSSYYQCWGLVSVSANGKWAGVPFFIFTEDGCRHEKNVEQRRLTLYRRKPEEE